MVPVFQENCAKSHISRPTPPSGHSYPTNIRFKSWWPYAAGSTPTKAGRMQTKYVCCHRYSDGELATDAYIDGTRKDRGAKKYVPICKACVNDEEQLVWSRGKKTNSSRTNAKRKHKEDERSNVRGKRTKNASRT